MHKAKGQACVFNTGSGLVLGGQPEPRAISNRCGAPSYQLVFKRWRINQGIFVVPVPGVSPNIPRGVAIYTWYILLSLCLNHKS